MLKKQGENTGLYVRARGKDTRLLIGKLLKEAGEESTFGFTTCRDGVPRFLIALSEHVVLPLLLHSRLNPKVIQFDLFSQTESGPQRVMIVFSGELHVERVKAVQTEAPACATVQVEATTPMSRLFQVGDMMRPSSEAILNGHIRFLGFIHTAQASQS